MRVKMTKTMAGPDGTVCAGQVIHLDDKEAKRRIKAGIATEAPPTGREKALARGAEAREKAVIEENEKLAEQLAEVQAENADLKAKLDAAFKAIKAVQDENADLKAKLEAAKKTGK